MSDFTYQSGDSSVPLETYEWDRTWIEHTENTVLPRVFYIGDSISCGIRPEMQKLASSQFLIDAVASSKALDNPFLLPTLELFLHQVKKPDLLIVNNGLHGWHLSDEAEYPRLLEALLLALRERQRIPVAVVLTTRVAQSDRNERVKARNAAAIAVAEKIGCPVFDLYTLSEAYASLQASDGVHYSGEGYQRLAEALAADVRKYLN